MNIKEIKEIVTLMNENEITEFIIEREGFKLSIKKGPQFERAAVITQAIAPAAPAIPIPASAGQTGEAKSEPEGTFIVSPMVGTFYSSPSPDLPSFVQVGQEVDEETVVCIIEAMKVMNEIKAERKGKILGVLAENGEAVEFGKKIFKIGDPSAAK
ncbi:MAG: acetyl-CoA carboxylase biotin carboxyl carrier protein [Candidatus Aureabacteria bacterium]|nr:acetyl-CoA carboxylase biotin carboxyl carrier protein [Candidatus Auribacterota bacterium]